MKNYYYLLGLKRTASLTEIKKAYRMLTLKFHPDKNDGDEFFIARFRDIQEAYETLSDEKRRNEYDSELEYENNNKSNRFNFNPEIEFFRTNVNEFEYDKEITFLWKTINADIVLIKPFGRVEPIGQRTYKIKEFKIQYLKFELIAKNSNIDRETRSSVTLENKTYNKLYKYFKDKIHQDEAEKRNKKNDSSSNRNNYADILKLSDGRSFQIIGRSRLNDPTYVRINNRIPEDGFYRLAGRNMVYKVRNSKIESEFFVEKFEQPDGKILEIGVSLTTGIYLGCPVWLNGTKAPDGTYKKGWLSKVKVKNGEVS